MVGSNVVANTFQRTKENLKKHQFLLEELVKRNFKKKYKRTILGVGWSLLSPLLSLLIMKMVFTQFFGARTPHYTIYIFCGTVVWSYFSEATISGMRSLMDNASIFTKVNVPKYLFLLASNIQALISFLLTIIILFIFVAFDSLQFSWRYLMLLYPMVFLLFFNLGVGMILSAGYVFFRDTGYLYDVFLRLLMYCSAIFYNVDQYGPEIQRIFLINPVYLFIKYFRCIIIEASIPSMQFHLLMLGYTVAVLAIGSVMYKKLNTRFLYYL